MATSLTYAFNRDRLLALINRPCCETIVFSLVNLIKHPHTEAYMYIYAQAHDKAGEAIKAQDIAGAGGEEACPVPPGWQCDLTPPVITKEQLELAPAFVISRAELLPLVQQNELILVGRNEQQQPEMMNQFLVQLEGENTGEGLEPYLSLTSLKADGTLLGTAKALNHTPGAVSNPAPVSPIQP